MNPIEVKKGEFRYRKGKSLFPVGKKRMERLFPKNPQSKENVFLDEKEVKREKPYNSSL